jgi:hypothetical protein
MWLEELGKLKEFNDHTVHQTCNLPACSISTKEGLGYYELKKQRFKGWCSKVLDQRKQEKLWWVEDPK